MQSARVIGEGEGQVLPRENYSAQVKEELKREDMRRNAKRALDRKTG
jgi:hypothetical protein